MGYYGYGMSAGTSPKRTPARSWPAGGTSSRFQPRGFPESIDPNNVRINGENRDLVMEGIHGLATLPGTVMDRPLAVANQVANRLTGTPAGFKGPIEQASDFVNSLPVVGDIVRGAGTAMRTSGEFTAALFNSQIASGLKMTATSPDGANAGAAGWFNRGFGGELDILAELLGQRYKGADKLTVGDLRQMALERGFTRQDIADLASGKKGIFDFGGLNAQGQPYKINQAPLIDLAGRIAFDPLNAAIVVGPARLLGAAEKIPGVNRVLGLTRARDLVLNDPAIKAVLDGPVLGVREGVRALQMGTTAGVTNRSVGLFLMGMSKGGGALLNSYVRKVAVPTTIGQAGFNAIDYALNGDEAPSGPFAWVWQLGRDIRDDKPLSNGMLFNLWSVMHFPATAIVQGYTKPAYRLYRDKFPKYRDIEVNLVDLTLKDVPEAKGLPYPKRRQMAMDRIPGGEANFWAYVDFLGQKHHAQFIALNEIDRVPASNMAELQMSAELAGSLVRNRMRVKADEFGGREAVEQAIDWSTGSRFNANKSLRKVMGGLRAVFNADRMWAQWGQWLSVASQISRAFAGIAPVVPAFQKTLIKERIAALREQFRDIADMNDGMIPASEAVRLLMDHPALIEHQGGFWGRMIVRDSRPVKFSWVEQRLKAAEKDAFSMHEVIATDANWGKLKDREAATRRNIRKPDGSLDLSLLETKGNVRVYVSTADDIARRDRLDMPDRLTDALSARANGTSILDDETIFGLRMAGYKVRSGKDGISIRDGGLAPGKEIVLDPSVDTQTAAQIAAHLVKRSGNDAPATLIADEAAVMAQGLKPNAVQLRWDVGKMDDLQRQGAIEALNEIANVAWADDTLGVLYVMLKKTDDIARLSDTASARLGAIFPDRAPDGLFRPESGKAWMQTIRDTSRSRSGRPATGARPLGDERTVADVAKHGRLREDWWAGEAELARIDERRLAGVARQPGPDAGPVGQEARAGAVGRVAEDLDRGQVAPRRIPDSDLVTQPSDLPDIADYLPDDPDGFYHVTTARDAVMREGLRPRAQTSTTGLGGGWNNQAPNMVSITYSGGAAALIEERITLAVKAARGEASVDEIVAHFSGYGAYSDDAAGMAQALGRRLDDPEDFAALDAIAAEYRGREYELVQKLDDGLTSYFDQPDGTVRVGLTGTQEQMARVDPNQIATLRVGVRRGANHDLVPDEMELRYAADDLDVLDDFSGAVAPDPVPPGVSNTGSVAYALDPLAPVETNFGSPFDTSGRKREGDDPFEDNGVREKIIDSPTITASERDAIRALQEDLFRNNPTYTLEVVPKGGTPYRYGEHPFADMVIDKQVAGDSWQMRWGGPVGAFQRIVFGKVYTRALQDDMKQEWFNKAINAGATPAQANGFLAALDTASEKVNILFGGRQARGDLLDPKTIKNIALGDKHGGIKVIRGFNGFDPKVIKAFGGPDGVVTALGESSSRIMRKIEQAHRASDGTGAMGRLLDTMYGQAQKGFRGKTGKSLSYLRTFYPLIRFKLSIRWQAMNKYEANIIGAIRHGAGHGKISKADKRAMERFSGTSLQDDLASGWLDQRDITDIMANSFREERLISAEDVVVNLASDSIALKALRERVGMVDGKVPTARQLAEELDRMMYGYDKVGVKRTITQELDQLIKQDAQFEAVRPLVERLTDINRKQWEGLFNGFRGNVNRSNIERTLNSYFLFWPISYQLKVAKLLTDVLTKRSFGRQTDLLGAWTVDRMWQEHTQRLVNDPEYVQMFKDNPTLWLMAGMMFPILPMDAGITESRLTRYVQSNVGAALGFWDKDERYPDNPVDMAVNVLRLGMAYDLELAERAAREMFKE